jgi:hypothetical protein
LRIIRDGEQLHRVPLAWFLGPRRNPGNWLAALADVVPADASGWLAVAARHWREQVGVGFTG